MANAIKQKSEKLIEDMQKFYKGMHTQKKTLSTYLSDRRLDGGGSPHNQSFMENQYSYYFSQGIQKQERQKTVIKTKFLKEL